MGQTGTNLKNQGIALVDGYPRQFIETFVLVEDTGLGLDGEADRLAHFRQDHIHRHRHEHPRL